MVDGPSMVVHGAVIAPQAMEWLGTARGTRVHSLYQNAINLIDEQGKLFTIVMPPLGPGPFALLLRPAAKDLQKVGGFVGLLEIDAPVRTRPGVLEVGEIVVRLTDLQIWDPRPNWPGLRAALTSEKIERLSQLLRLHAPPGSLAPLVDRAALASIFESGSGEDLRSALLRSIAGPARRVLKGLILFDRGQIRQAASELAGLGGGVTPAGDDFMEGAVHALWATRDPEQAQDLSSVVVEAASPRTNAVSLAWLLSAARGEAGSEWHALFDAVTRDAPLDPAAGRLIRRGHTSGADALAGFLAFLRAMQPLAEKERRLPEV